MPKHLNKFNKIVASLQNLDDEILDEIKRIVVELITWFVWTFNYHPTIWKSRIRLEDVSNTLMNDKYQKLDKKVHQELDSDVMIVRGTFENKNQGEQGRSCFKLKYLEKDEYYSWKKANGRKIVQNWPNVRRCMAQLETMYTE